jgi:hypothetical protein
VEQRVEDPLADTILDFNEDLVEAFWFAEASGNQSVSIGETLQTASWDINQYLTGLELDDTLAFLDRLQDREEFIGMKKLSIEFLSFDFQGNDQAVVTTRENWQETLHSGTPTYGVEPVVIGERSYVATIAYTMEREGDQWVISRIVITPDPPGWSAP